jgi:nitrate/TMAO reductase-like tetraheme cytochrome c subunit
MKITLGRRTVMLGAATTIIVGGIALAILGAGGIVAWEYSNSNAFCTNNCHAVHPEEPRAYAAYSHARVQCVECHMGRLPTLQLMTLKVAHYQELLGMITGYQRPLAATTLRPARDSCESCHWPSVNHDDKVHRSLRDRRQEHRDARGSSCTPEAAARDIRAASFGIDRNSSAAATSRSAQSWVRITAKDRKRRPISTPRAR